MPGVASIALGCWVPVGARDEPAAEAGASHFLEHLLFKGTSERGATEIARQVDARGAEMNAFTSKEHTAYYLRFAADDLGWALELLGDVLTRPAFRPDDIEAERQVILEELSLSRDTPDDLVHTLLFEAMFPAHPVGREVLGDTDTVGAMQRDEIAGFHGRYYGPGNYVVAAAGEIDHTDLVQSVNAWQPVEDLDRPSRQAPGGEVVELVVQHRPTEQAHMALGWRAYDYSHDDRYTLAVANQVLGGAGSSRLFQEVREKRGLAYTVFSGPTPFTDCGALTIYVGSSPDRFGESLEVVLGVVDDLAADGIDDRELETAKGFLRGSLVLGLEDTGSRMARIGSSEAIRGQIISIDEHLARIEAVTRADVARVLRDVLDAPRSVAAVGPFDRDHKAFARLSK